MTALQVIGLILLFSLLIAVIVILVVAMVANLKAKRSAPVIIDGNGDQEMFV